MSFRFIKDFSLAELSRLELAPDESLGLLTSLFEMELPQDLGFLDAAELERAGTMLSPERHDQFVKSRFFLKKILAHITGRSLSELRVEILGEGRPQLVGHLIDFNISHSESFLFLGLCRGSRIGVDIERRRERKNWWEISQKICADSELKILEELKGKDIPLAQQAFFELWSLKEAVLKANGGGVFKHAATTQFIRKNEWTLAHVPSSFYPVSSTRTHLNEVGEFILATAVAQTI